MASQHFRRTSGSVAMVDYDDQQYDRGPASSYGGKFNSSNFTSWGTLPNSNGSMNLNCKSKDSSESFCGCKRGEVDTCSCGEEDTEFAWVWDKETASMAAQITSDFREVKFHQEYSCGTAAVRGSQQLKNKQYYWEIKMTTSVYGTDMMIGVGTSLAKLDKCLYSFCSLLGSDAESWGLSYTGYLYHDGKARKYAPKFGWGSIIGVHLDMLNGTLTFYKNRKSLGVAFTNLQDKALYPMLSSTAAKSGMKLIRSRCYDSSLQYSCIHTLRNTIPANVSLLDAFNFPPGLNNILSKNYDWLVGPSQVGSFEEAKDGDDDSQILRRKYTEIEEDAGIFVKRRRFIQKSTSHSLNI